MKIAIIGKGGAGKTTISVLLIQALAKHKKIVAIDADSNKNLIDYLGFEKDENILELGDIKPEIFKISGVAGSEYERKYYPKNDIGVFYTDGNDSVFSKISYKNENIQLIELGSPREQKIGVTGMCPYNETIKVYLSNLVEKENEIIFIDFAAGSEVAGKGIIASVDHILIPLEPNSKNLDVAKDIYKTLKLIHFENIHFIANKIRTPEDLEYIKNYFENKIDFIGSIPFSKEVMKADISGNLHIDNFSDEIQKNYLDIKDKILLLSSDRKKALERVKKLDILKGDKKCH
ncbi:MAG: AAA family ATPase [Candidatus Altimarinota bacterium]